MNRRRGDRVIADEIDALLNIEKQARGLIRQARNSGDGGSRARYLEQAQRAIAKLNPARHGRLINQLQSEVLALQGRRGDRVVAHLTPGEVVVPQRLQTPAVKAALSAAAQEAGIDLSRLVVGNAGNSYNPQTGAPEFFGEQTDDPPIEEITVLGNLITDDPSTNNVIAGLHPSIRYDTAKFINDVKDRTGQQLRIPYGSGMRTPADQDALFAQGRTAPGNVVTRAPGGKSYHNYGLAFDVVGLDADGKTPNYNVDFGRFAPIAQERGFEWGGNWSTPDRPHFQQTYEYTPDQLRQMMEPGSDFPTIPGRRNR